MALQIQWAAQQLHPALFSETDMVARIRDFYQRFFDYPLSDAEAHLILLGFAPRPRLTPNKKPRQGAA